MNFPPRLNYPAGNYIFLSPSDSGRAGGPSSSTGQGHIHECELVLIHLCYMGISSFAGDLINSVIWLEEAPNSTCVTSVAGLCLRIRVAHNQAALSVYPVSGQWGIMSGIPIFLRNNSNTTTTGSVFCDKQHLRAWHTLGAGPGSFVSRVFFLLEIVLSLCPRCLKPLS